MRPPPPWGISSVGRALALHARGQGFESPHLHFYFFAGVAQLVEHLVANQIVASSSLATRLFFFALVAQLVEHLICNQDVVGSIPIEGFFHTYSSAG